ncbi:MAG: hypothetical protein U0359_37620 [Byssovorax sp.]
MIRFHHEALAAAIITLGLIGGCGSGSSTGTGTTGTGGSTGTTGTTTGTGGCGGAGCGAPVACDPLAGTPAENDVCANKGELCDIACSNCQMKCSDDGLWHEDCHGCPDSAPADGDACDPCSATGECNYIVDTTCGMKPATATCDSATSTWKVVPEACP